MRVPIVREKPSPNPLMRLGIAVAERVTGRRMVPARVLAWYPRAAVSSGVMESLVAHADRQISDRELRFVRLAASFTARCPFCVDMNGHNYESAGLTTEDVTALREGRAAELPHLTPRERVAIEYAQAASSTPLRFDNELLERVTALFTEREVVILASTAAQVNYWARLIQALQIPPAGFTDGEFRVDADRVGAAPFAAPLPRCPGPLAEAETSPHPA